MKVRKLFLSSYVGEQTCFLLLTLIAFFIPGVRKLFLSSYVGEQTCFF